MRAGHDEAHVAHADAIVWQMAQTEVRHHSFRLPSRLLDRLRTHADRRGVSQTALVARYIDEGMKMDSYPLIVYRDSPLGRPPMLEGSRLDVVQVVETVRNQGGDVAA